jgi:hypothetical protein
MRRLLTTAASRVTTPTLSQPGVFKHNRQVPPTYKLVYQHQKLSLRQDHLLRLAHLITAREFFE